MKLWTTPQDVDDEISMMLSAEFKEKEQYQYHIIKLMFRDKNKGKRHKAIQLISMTGAERLTTEEAEEWLLENIWSNPIMRMTPTGESLYQNALKEKKARVGMNR